MVIERSRPISEHRPCTRMESDLSADYTRRLSGTCHSCSQALGSLPCEELELVGRETHECILSLDYEAGLVDFIVF